MFIRHPDGSILNEDGNVIFFSVDKFVKDICYGNCCFICGASPLDTEFNNEHILPDWILRKYNLFSKKITLPNGSTFKYAQYKIPCCTKCNTTMGDLFERPISKLVENGYSYFVDYIKNNDFSFLLNWLALIFIKTHLKDNSLRLDRDTRKNEGYIADFYKWGELHHIHCVARSFYTKCNLDPNIQGTVLILPAKIEDEFELFDYMDLYFAKTMLLRMGEIAIIHVLDDSCAVMNLHQSILDKITRPLSHLQLRELTATFAYENTKLIERPNFYSDFDMRSNAYKIVAKIPNKLRFFDFDAAEYGSIMSFCLKDYIQTIPYPERDNVEHHIKNGEYTFLFDKDGNLISN